MSRAALLALMGAVPAKMTFSDTFNRATAGSLGSDWVDLVRGYGVASNAARPTATNQGFYVTRWATPCLTDDQYSQFTITSRGVLQGPSCFVRGSATGHTNYSAQVATSGSALVLKQFQSGSETNLASYAVWPVSGDVVRIEVSGEASLRVYLNGALVISHTATTVLTGRYVGLSSWVDSALGLQDDWYGGDL